MNSRRATITVPLAAVTLVLLAGCNAEERGHPVKLAKGDYAGTADSVLSDATRLTLRQRMIWLSDGPAEVATGPALAMPSGEAAVAGRITGQNY
ncbi:MAG: hypothetical protein EPN20_05345 [Magnetospirillum sp.]|nr:MAG: hypothetical protein EPN20_05345 [Magnetospirillum sp.]